MLRKILSKFILVVIGIAIVSSIALFFAIGNILVEIDDLEQTDIIVVLMGSIPDRILEAVDLYKEGYSGKIVLVEEYSSSLLRERDIDIPIGAEINKMIAVKYGVPKEAVVIIEGNSQSTQDEALNIRDYLKEASSTSSMMLVTSKYHSFRAKKIFEKALKTLDRNIKVISYPTKYDKFNPKKWWKRRADIKNVIFEVIKLLNFYFNEQFKID